MITADDIINQARYNELFVVRVRVGTFSLKMPAPWDIQVRDGILECSIPARNLDEARVKCKEVVESSEWEYL
ncbi:hypothetical protein UFOVP328_368 [uncultured Caudovirales phage]|uniref:Uncharacterized protein n=1 Tax=uncultured Caudovirales phage TaxID=2100421 RepID=A0A6J5LUP6_9CAUD|nr:hypothetical protein UFOVP328_368 [uncultured Caudovirales phage]